MFYRGLSFALLTTISTFFAYTQIKDQQNNGYLPSIDIIINDPTPQNYSPTCTTDKFRCFFYNDPKNVYFIIFLLSSSPRLSAIFLLYEFYIEPNSMPDFITSLIPLDHKLQAILVTLFCPELGYIYYITQVQSLLQSDLMIPIPYIQALNLLYMLLVITNHNYKRLLIKELVLGIAVIIPQLYFEYQNEKPPQFYDQTLFFTMRAFLALLCLLIFTEIRYSKDDEKGGIEAPLGPYIYVIE